MGGGTPSSTNSTVYVSSDESGGTSEHDKIDVLFKVPQYTILHVRKIRSLDTACSLLLYDDSFASVQSCTGHKSVLPVATQYA